MRCKMEHVLFMLIGIPVMAIAITVSSNGNSPEIKMVGGMMVDVQKGFVPMTPKPDAKEVVKSNYDKSRKLNLNTTKLSINERYRRLIPYMTFYYANDLGPPTTESYSTKDVEVEKVHIVEASPPERTAKKLSPMLYNNVPRYQGNRLTKYNIASANPGRLFKDVHSTYHAPAKVTQNYNPLGFEHKYVNGHNVGRFATKQNIIKPDTRFSIQRRPYVNLFHIEDESSIRYFSAEKEPEQKFKLIPYEQTPPVTENVNFYESYRKPVPVMASKEQVYLKPRPIRPLHTYNNVYYQPPAGRKQPVIISENYYDKLRPSGHSLKVQPIIESGFKPIISDHITQTTISPIYMSTVTESPHVYYGNDNAVQVIETSSIAPEHGNSFDRPNYYQYVDQPYRQSSDVSNSASLSDLLHSLQRVKSIPKPITRENVGSSIKTLLQVLNTLRVIPHQNEVEAPVLSTPKPFVAAPKIVEITTKPVVEPVSELNDAVEFSHEPYLAPVNPPSQHLDDFSVGGGSTQTFPLVTTSDDDGGTPGRAGVDYPILTTIPPTSFDCKTQRYKGFFADPETRCQVWHYCDLNGGQASFLCPNGTIFSQAGLTCDWWFNVRCASTAQLYVLNESLYKYILPHSPKFPEDYSGPLVDKYLTLKFKEMEEQFKKNKNRQSASEKMDSEEKNDSEEESVTTETTGINGLQESIDTSSVSEANIVVETPGTSGNVERLQV